jgi:hypothetical protein
MGRKGRMRGGDGGGGGGGKGGERRGRGKESGTESGGVGERRGVVVECMYVVIGGWH